MTTPTRRNLLSLATAAALLVVLPACYTMFQHPRVESERYARPSTGCLNCHSRESLWQLVHNVTDSADETAWDEYYNRPWWFHKYLRGDTTSTDADHDKGGNS
jgi:hypothetical protein